MLTNPGILIGQVPIKKAPKLTVNPGSSRTLPKKEKAAGNPS
jgi:hypothetical protein